MTKQELQESVERLERRLSELEKESDALRRSEQLYRLLAENVTDIIFTMDMNLRQTYISPSVERIRGFTPEEAMAQTLDEALTPESLTRGLEKFAEGLQRAQTNQDGPPIGATAELELTCKDGSTVWMECQATGLRDENDVPSGIIGVARDITERRKTEKALRESEEAYRTLVETSPDSITMTDMQGNFIMANQQAARHHGCDTVEEFLASGANAFELIAPEDQARAAENTRKTIEQGFSGPLEYTVLRRDGKRFPAELTAALVVDADGEPKGFIGVVRDVSGRRRDERELAGRYSELVQAHKDLERLQRSRDEFLAMVSHELRTPLVTGLGYLELALDGQLGSVDEQAETGLRVSLKNLRRLASLIDDVLNYHGLIRRGHRRSPVLAPVSVGNLFQEAVSEFQVRSGGRAPAITIILPEHCPHVMADEDMIHRALSNLLNNAARHAGPEARIEVKAELEGDERVRICVVDDGKGMPSELAERVFEPFVKSSGGSGGSGLGLAILRTIVEAHDGTVELQTAPDEGTRVCFCLRVDQHERVADPPAEVRPGRSASNPERQGTILVVEDDEDTLAFLEQALLGEGYAVRTAMSAEAAEASMKHEAVDLILVDLCLPGADGDELCRRIKSDPRTSGIPVYIITARAEQDARNRAESAGCDGYLVKPIGVRKLVQVLQSGMP